MPKFALEKIEPVKGKITFYKLIINGKCEYDEFFEALEDKEKDNVAYSLLATLNTIANLGSPGKKFKQLKGREKGDNIKDYEAIYKNYRLYFFNHHHGKIVAFGSKKGKNQKRDIKRLRTLKHEFTNNYRL